MRIADVPATDVRAPLTAQRKRLLGLLAGLGDAEWGSPTAAPRWSVKDIALHLIDVDLSWVARFRDHDRSGFMPESAGHEAFVRGLAQRNQQWIDGTRVLSPRLIIDMLRWSGGQLDAVLATVDLGHPSSVYWAGEAPLWFDLAREFTERWVHFQQIREAVARPRPEQGPYERGQSGPDEHRGSEGHDPGTEGGDRSAADQDRYLPLLVRTFMWGFPHQYRAPAPTGTTVGVEINGVGAWSLTRSDSGAWELDEGWPAEPAASLRASGDAAWRLLTGAPYDPAQARLSGEPALARPLLHVRGIIV
jgi:uncharacterized protein (TIGR03083 family)